MGHVRGTEARRFCARLETLPRDERLGSFADAEETEPHDEPVRSRER
jgi:hypothetical protein